jgi:hypothetical protein
MVSVAGAALGALAIILATVLEELTHLAAGRPWAVRQRLDWPACHAIQELPESTDRRVDVWISLAPLAVGVIAMALVILGRGVPPLSDETVLFWVAWAWFTTPGLSDIKAACGNPDHEIQTLADPELRAAWTGVSISSVGLLLLYGSPTITDAATATFDGLLGLTIGVLAYRAGVWVSLAGPAWTLLLLTTADE